MIVSGGQLCREARRATATSALLVAFFSCATAAPALAASNAAPANYRQAVATALRRMVDVSTVRSAHVSKPRVKWIGAFHGGSRPAVCVSLVRPNVFGMQARFNYVFYFENGRAEGFQESATGFVQQAIMGCLNEQFSPFKELGRPR